MENRNVVTAFGAQVSRVPSNTAVEWRNRQVSYRELDHRSNQIADWLMASGAASGDLVLVAMENSFHVIPALLGIWKAGCVFVPIDVSNPEARIRAMIAAVDPKWAITEESVAGLLAHLSPVPKGATLRADSDPLPSNVDTIRIQARTAIVEPDDLCYLSFTSGSTGTPKAIAGRHKGLTHFIEWETKSFQIDETCRVSQFSHPAFDAFFRDVFLPLSCGGAICIPDSRESMLDGEKLLRWIDEARLQLIHCVPSLFRMMGNAGLRTTMFPDLKYVLMAGESLSPADVGKWMEIFGDRIQFVNLYGSTETTMVKFFHRITRDDLDRKTIRIGRPLEGARALIVNEQGKAFPPNSVGEIWIRTPYLSLGYYKDPDSTARVFIPNPFNNDPRDIVYRTGDLGRMLPDGTFEFIGRTDFQVKIRGVRVELGEIESALRAQPGILDAVAIAIQEANDTHLVAFVAAAADFDIAGLRKQLLMRLPANLVPPTIVRLDSLPRTPNGKVDRKALPALERKRNAGTPFRQPATPTERQMAEIWCELLAVEKVGADDDFFELGGHSLLATQLMARIRSAFDIEVPLGRLFEDPTLSRLALAVEEAQFEAANEDELAEVLDEIESTRETADVAASRL